MADLLTRNMAELSQYLGRFQSVGNFRHMSWPVDGEETLQLPHYRPNQWQHLKDHGFAGSFVEYSLGGPIFKEWELLAGLLGSVVRGGRAVADSRL